MKKGFTLIEILIAVTIIAILTAIGIVSYNSVNRRARDAKRKSDIEQMRSALEIYRNDYGVYPGTATGFIELTPTENTVVANLVPVYLPSVPADPKSTSAHTVSYWYDPLGYSGATTFYAYCICGGVENSLEGGNQCPGVDNSTLPIALSDLNRTPYCVYSP